MDYLHKRELALFVAGYVDKVGILTRLRIQDYDDDVRLPSCWEDFDLIVRSRSTLFSL